MTASRISPATPIPALAVSGPSLHLLGRLELLSADGTILLGPGKPLALLAYLRTQSVHAATRPHLIDLLWSDLEPERARANVRQALLVLRRLLPEGALVSEGDQVLLCGALPTDRDAFVAAVDRGDLTAAIAGYRGDFIPDLAVPGGAEFEMWCEIERRHLAALFARVLENVARAELVAGHAPVALAHARRLRDMDPSRERSWRLLIETEIAAEGLASARLEAERLADLLRSDGRPPEPATAQLFQRVRDVARQASADSGPLTTPEFVGRETQLARILGAWGAVRRGRRHQLHVEALAGTGKTRLLEESCARLQAAGARVVQVGARRDERDVPFALAASLVTSLASLPGSIAVAPASMSALVAMAPDVSATFAAPPDTATGDEAIRRRAVAIADLVGAVTHEGTVAIAMDDTHWADPVSLHVISLALGRLEKETRLLVLSAGREPLPGEGSAERVSLPPLTGAQVDAMLQSLGGAGDKAWWPTFVDALRDAAGGTPFHVLQLLHAVVEKRLLVIEDECWVAPNVPALLAALDAQEAAQMRIAQLPVSARAVLRVLCFGAVPDTVTVAAAVGGEPATVEADLGRLELRGYARRVAGGGWTTAHDEISDLMLAQSDLPSLVAARRGLAHALAGRPSVTVAEMRHIVGLLMQASADAEVEAVVRRWVRSGGCPNTGVHASDLMARGIAEERLRPLRRTVQRLLPQSRRRTRSRIRNAAVLAAVALASWYLTRPAALIIIQEPILTNVDQVTDAPAVIGVVDRLGRRLSVSGRKVVARGVGAGSPSGGTETVMRDGVAPFDSLIVGGTPSHSNALQFESAGLRPARWSWKTSNPPRLRLRSGLLNGQVLQGAVPVLRLKPGERLQGQIFLSYWSQWTSATVFLGEASTWDRREVDTTSIRSLVTPLDQGTVQLRVERRGPTTPGTYFLIWAMGAEPRGAYLFSLTNWSCGDPIWRDGNDIQDVPADSLRAVAAVGTMLRDGVRCIDHRNPAPPHSFPQTLGVAAVEVVVGRPPP